MATTQAGRDLTDGHQAGQIAIAASLTAFLRRTWPVLDPADLNDSTDAWLRVVVPLVLKARGESVALGTAYFQQYALAEASREVLASPAVLTDAARKALEISARITGPTTIKTLTAGGMDTQEASSTAFSLFHESMARHALAGGRNTIVDSLAGTDVGWRRIGRADGKRPCDFCRMLIGRGEVYSAETAIFAAHDRCRCQAEPAFDGGEPVNVKQYTASQRNISAADRARVRRWLAEDRAREGA